MAKIILNNEEFNFQGYNRNTYFGGETMNSNAYINGLSGENFTTRLQNLSNTPITSIRIIVGEDTIYNLTNVSANLNSMDESFNGVDSMNTNINLQFS